jgi:excisionase family DNA binding protein
MHDTNDLRLLVNIEQARAAIGLGRTKFYELIKDGQIRIVRIGNRTLVPVSELERLATPEG